MIYCTSFSLIKEGKGKDGCLLLLFPYLNCKTNIGCFNDISMANVYNSILMNVNLKCP